MASSKTTLRPVLFLVLLIALGALAFRTGLFDPFIAEPLPWPTQWDHVVKQADESPRPILLFFESAGCPPCRWMRYQVWTDSLVQAAIAQRVWPVSLDLSDSNAVVLANRYGVTHTPTVILVSPQGVPLVDPQGRPLWAKGFQSAEKILALLKRLPPKIKSQAKASSTSSSVSAEAASSIVE